MNVATVMVTTMKNAAGRVKSPSASSTPPPNSAAPAAYENNSGAGNPMSDTPATNRDVGGNLLMPCASASDRPVNTRSTRRPISSGVHFGRVMRSETDEKAKNAKRPPVLQVSRQHTNHMCRRPAASARGALPPARRCCHRIVARHPASGVWCRSAVPGAPQLPEHP